MLGGCRGREELSGRSEWLSEKQCRRDGAAIEDGELLDVLNESRVTETSTESPFFVSVTLKAARSVEHFARFTA